MLPMQEKKALKGNLIVIFSLGNYPKACMY